MDSKRLAEIADVMEDRGLTRVRVRSPMHRGRTRARERRAAGCRAHAYAGRVTAPAVAPVAMPAAAPEPAAQTPAAASEPKGTEVTAPMVGVSTLPRRRATSRLCTWAPRSRPARPSASSRP